MALIVDPDNLHQNVEVIISPATKTVRLLVTGSLSNDGVTLKCLYSFLKEQWKVDAELIKYPFPMVPITDEQFEMVNTWDFFNDTSRYLVRTGGWALKDTAGVSQEEWAGIVTLGSIGSTDQAYFEQIAASASINFQLTGPVNQAVKVYGDGTHGNYDYRSFMKVFAREYAKSYAAASLSDIGVTTMTYQVYRFPLANAADIKITHTDVVVSGSVPYTGIDITWYVAAQQRNIGGTNRDFHVIIDGNNGTAEQIYERVQYLLRQTYDIDAGAGSQLGNITSAPLRFVGDTLYTQLMPAGGVFIDNYQAADINRIVFVDDLGIERTFPFTAALTINFGDNLKNDPNAQYWVYFTNASGSMYGTTNAILVQDSSGQYMSGSVSGSVSIQRTFAYDTNAQGGRTPATDADITAVAIGLSVGQFVKATSTIARSIANSVSLVAPLERNYSNP